MIWKQPVQIKNQGFKQRFRRNPEFRLRRLLKSVPLPIPVGWLLLVVLFLCTAPLSELGWFDYACVFLTPLVFLLCAVLVNLVSNTLALLCEATYRLDDTAIRIKKTFYTRRIPWKYVAKLEVVPHPTLENIGLIKTVEGITFRPQVQSALQKIGLLRFVSGMTYLESIEEIPFEVGKIDVAEVHEMHKKYRPKYG